MMARDAGFTESMLEPGRLMRPSNLGAWFATKGSVRLLRGKETLATVTQLPNGEYEADLKWSNDAIYRTLEPTIGATAAEEAADIVRDLLERRQEQDAQNLAEDPNYVPEREGFTGATLADVLRQVEQGYDNALEDFLNYERIAESAVDTLAKKQGRAEKAQRAKAKPATS